MKQPFFGFIIGGLLASIWPSLALLLAPLCLVVIVIVWIQPSRILSALFFMAGIIWVSWHWVHVEGDALELSAGKSTQVATGYVSAVSHQSYKTHFDFTQDGHTQALKVSCYRCPFMLSAGERWQFTLRIKPIYSFQNPGGFNYRHWMMAKGYRAQASVDVKSHSNVRLTKNNRDVLNQLSAQLPSSRFPILRALVLGDKSALKGEDKRLISSSGISHLFVVSGLHVGIVAGLVGLILYWLQRPLLLINWPYARSISVMAGLCAAMLYGYMTGFQVPAIRAVLMLLCGVFMLYQTRFTHVIHYYVFALLVVMLMKPLAFMDMGSWLSFSIVLALIVGFSGLTHTSWWSGLLKAQWLAFSMGGLVLLGFNQALVPFSLLVNLLLIPLFTILVMPAVLLAVTWMFVVDDQGLVLLESGLSSLLLVLHKVESVITWWLPIHEHYRYLFMISLILGLLPAVFKTRPLALAIGFVVLILPINKPDEGGFELIVFDVGQGSAALIKTANKYVLVDTGAQFLSGLGVADFVILPYLRQQRVRYLDMLHVTHADNDHAGNAQLMNSMAGVLVEQKHCESRQWEYDGVLFWRFQAEGFVRGNNGSCLLKVTAASGKSVLFTGDIEKEAERQLVVQENNKLQANVLIAPHHGSRSSSTDPFLNEVMPELVLISAGFLNRYGHPHVQIVNKYEARNMMVYTTAMKGSIQVAFPPRQEALVVSTYRPNFSITE
ncbi:DNA internalization-related competence protein ComEC/Rec2 [Pseudomonas sp. HK3]